MTLQELAPMRNTGRILFLATLAVLALGLAATAAAQLGPRTMANARTFGLDAGGVGDQMSISSSDGTKHKMELISELQYMKPEQWQAASVTWLRFRHGEDGSVVVTEEGAPSTQGEGVVRALRGSGKWEAEPLEDGGWKVVSRKKGGKMDLYLDTQFKGEPFTVDAVVPKFDGEAYGAIYRGLDFLFFVVQKKHPEAAEG